MPFRSRYRLELSHDDIEKRISQIVDAGVIPLSVGGDHSISHPILKAVGKKRPVGMIHIDAHCDTGGAFDQTKFHHGGPFRNAVLDGVLDPTPPSPEHDEYAGSRCAGSLPVTPRFGMTTPALQKRFRAKWLPVRVKKTRL